MGTVLEPGAVKRKRPDLSRRQVVGARVFKLEAVRVVRFEVELSGVADDCAQAMVVLGASLPAEVRVPPE